MNPFGIRFGGAAAGISATASMARWSATDAARGRAAVCFDHNSGTSTGSAVMAIGLGRASRHCSMSERNQHLDSDMAVTVSNNPIVPPKLTSTIKLVLVTGRSQAESSVPEGAAGIYFVDGDENSAPRARFTRSMALRLRAEGRMCMRVLSSRHT